MEQIHSLLKRQLKRCFSDQFSIPKDFQRFIDAVNDAYWESDMDREMLERSLELSSQELLQANSEVRAIFLAIPDLLFRIDSEGKILNYKAGATSDLMLRPKELLGKRIQDVPLKQVSEKFNEAIQHVQKSKAIVSIEYSLSIQGQLLFFEARLVPLPEDQIVVIIRNITERKQVEKALQESENKFRAIINGMIDTVWVIGSSANIIDVNNSAVEVMGYSREELLSMKIGDIDADQNPKEIKELTSKMPTDKIQTFEAWHKTKDGRKFPVEINSSLITYGDKKAVLCIARDITERKRAEEELRESEERYRDLVEVSPDAVAVHANGRIVYVNPAAVKLLRAHNSSELIGKPVLDVVHSDYKELVRMRITGAQEHGKAQPITEEKFLCLDGTVVDVEVVSVPTTFKGINAVQVIARNITERKQAEESLKRERNLFRVLIDNLPDAIYVKDTECRKTIANVADVRNMGKQSEAEVLGKTDYDLYPAEIAAGFYADDHYVIQSGKSVINKEEYFIDKDGKKDWLLTFKLPMRDEQGKIIGLVGIGREITEQKHAMEELFNSQQMLRMVLDTIPQRVFWKDRDLFFVGCNKPLALDCGYSDPAQLIGKTDYETASAKVADLYRADDRQVIETGQPKFDYEESQIRPDGSLRWLRTSKVPLRDKDGRVIGVLGTYEDITEQKRAMEALNLLSHAVKSIGEAISITDLKNNLLFVNEAFLRTYGYTEQEIIGKPISIVSCDPIINDQVVLAETLKGGWQGELLNRKKDGTVFSISLSTSVVNDEKGQPIGLVGVATDITERKQAQEALRESDEKLRNIVENSTNLFYSRNINQVFTYLSPQARNILDCEPDEALINFTDFMTDNSINKLGLDLAKKAVQTGARQEAYELELMSKKGRRVWVEIQEAPVVKDGKTISIVGAATDITERRWAEMALQVSEKKYRDIVTWAPIGIYQSTPSGKLLSCNSSIAELLGYDSVNELVGCNMGQVIYYDDKDRERFVTKDNSSEKKGTFSHETRWKTKNGSIIWVLMTIHDVRDKSSEILYYEGFVFDITERKHAEESLRESEERYRLLVENSTDIVTEISAQDKYLYVSPNVKSTLDFEPMDLVGTDVLSRVYGKDKNAVGEILSKLGGSATYRYRDRIGGWHWFESSGRVYYTSSGEQRMVMVSRDITQRRKAEQELELSRKQLQHFTEHLEYVLEEERKRISRELHDELGQLLTILKFDISWLRLEGVKSDSDAIAKIDSMMESVNEALASVKRIAKEIRPPQLDALGLVGAIQWDIDQAEKKTGIKGIVTVEPTEFEIKGQISTVLYRVFREALTNILRHAQAKQIFIRLSQRSGFVILTIRDDGRGITKRELKGKTSLGLVGIRERIRTVGGTLTIEGKAGSGTMVSVKVPLKKKNGESIS